MKKLSLTALILCVALLFTGCQSVVDSFNGLMDSLTQMTGKMAQSSFIHNKETKMKFSEMVYARPDLEAMEQAVAHVCQVAETEQNGEKVMAAVYDFYALYDNFDTMYCLADIHYNMNLSNTYWEEEYAFCSREWNFAGSCLDEVYAGVAKSPILEELEAEYFGDGFFDSYLPGEEAGEDWEYQSLWQQGLLELSRTQSDLESKYYTILEESQATDELGNTDYEALLQELAPLYIEMILHRQEMAQFLGYGSYEEYCAAENYNRDMTMEEIGNHLDMVKAHLVPLYREYANHEDSYRLYKMKATEEDCLNYVRSGAEAMGGIVEEAFREMENRELYHITYNPNKADGAYEIYLTDYAAPFILVSPTHTLIDLTTFAHEFGHFTNDYAARGTYTSADVGEVMSQSMEYLMLLYSRSLPQEEMEKMHRGVLLESLYTYVEQSAYYSFERRAHALPQEELTPERLCQLYEDVVLEFGLNTKGYHRAEWVSVPHFFLYPFYVYGYAASADVAMQIYELEQTSEGSGLALYKELVYRWEDLSLSQYIEEYESLQSPTASGRMEALASLYREALS